MKLKLSIAHHPLADWFFPLVSVRILRLYRICVGLVTFVTAMVWLPHVNAFFTSQGYVSADWVYTAIPVYSKLSIFFLYDAPWFVYLCFALFLFSLLASIFGFFGRASAILNYVLFLSFASRFPAVFYGGIDVLHHLLFFNMLHPAPAYQHWKVGGVKERSRAVPAWSMRMIQLTFCIIYFFAGLNKIRSNSWLGGTELINSLSTRFGIFDTYWLRSYPIVINIFSYGSWMIEISFPFLIFNTAVRRFMLITMAAFHIGIRILINASLFSEIMLVGLISFISPADEARFVALWHKYTDRLWLGAQRWWHKKRLRRTV